MNNDSKRVGVIGLGAMGAPMADQILRKHGQVNVFGVVPAAVQKLVAAGAKAAVSPKEVGESSDIVITCFRIRTCSATSCSARTASQKE